MKHTVGAPGPWASDERKLAFLQAIPQYVTMLAAEGVKWTRAKAYPDYYPDLPGGRVGRAIEVKPFNMRKLGAYADLIRPGGLPLPVKTDDVWLLSRAWSTPSGFVRGARLVFRTLSSLALGQRKAGMGAALAGSLMYVIQKRGIPLWLSSPLRELIVENGRVVGAVVEKEGKPVRVRARRGVMLAAGGFAMNAEWRKRYQGLEGWTSAPEGQLGEGIDAGARVGGELAMMEDAWWAPPRRYQGGRTRAPLSSPSAPTPGASSWTSAALATSTSPSRISISGIT
jgi:3-oxosteroid 1-dehydrogenase